MIVHLINEHPAYERYLPEQKREYEHVMQDTCGRGYAVEEHSWDKIWEAVDDYWSTYKWQ